MRVPAPTRAATAVATATEPVPAAPADARFELKFVARTTELHALEHWVRLNRAGLRRVHPERRVNNVYFDTPDLLSFLQVGSLVRSKLRLRWYGSGPGSDHCVLEVKHRHNQLGWKARFDVGALDLERGDWREVDRRLRAALPPEAVLWLDHRPRPVLLNHYQRRYFATPDAKVRVTIDTLQAVYGQRFGTWPNTGRRANPPDTIVVEVKFGRDDERLGSRVIQGIPIRVARNSKYAIGVQSLLGGG